MTEITFVFHEGMEIVRADEKQPRDVGEPCWKIKETDMYKHTRTPKSL